MQSFLDPKQLLEYHLDQLDKRKTVSENEIKEVATTLNNLIPLAQNIIKANSDMTGFKVRMFFQFVIREIRAHSLLLNDPLMSDEEMRLGEVSQLLKYIRKVDQKAPHVEDPLDAASYD